MVGPQPGLGIPIRLALLPADAAGLHPSGGSRHSTTKGQRRGRTEAKLLTEIDGSSRPVRRIVLIGARIPRR